MNYQYFETEYQRLSRLRDYLYVNSMPANYASDESDLPWRSTGYLIQDLKLPRNRREHQIDLMAMIDMHVGGFPRQEESQASLYIIKSFVKSKQNFGQCCAYLILTVEKFTNHHVGLSGFLKHTVIVCSTELNNRPRGP